MEVLKYGENYPDGKWQYEIVCTGKGNGLGGCGSTLKISTEDLVYYPGSDSPYSSQPNESVCIKCVVCSAITDVDRILWPKQYSKLTRFSTVWKDN